MSSQQVTRQVSLSINNQPVGMDYFVQGFIDHVVSGMMEILEGAGRIKTLELSIDGEQVKIVHNGNVIAANPFVTSLIAATVNGMVSSLKGVTKIKTVSIGIKK